MPLEAATLLRKRFLTEPDVRKAFEEEFGVVSINLVAPPLPKETKITLDIPIQIN